MPKKSTKKITKKVETKSKSRTTSVGTAKQMVRTVAKPKKTVSKTVVSRKLEASKKPKSRPISVGTTKPAPKVPEVKSDLVKKYRSGAKDTGSVAVQVALLTDRINALAKHLSKHIHDFDSKRGLLILVGKRRRLLNYLRKTDEKVYTKLVKDLKLKK